MMWDRACVFAKTQTNTWRRFKNRAPIIHRQEVRALSDFATEERDGCEPSNLPITDRYILQPEIFDQLATQESGAGGEIQLTDAMMALAKKQSFYGLKFDGRSFDCGSKIGFLTANVCYALAREDIAPGSRKEIQAMLRDI
jgi:UTP--glucose-1-phosphate uridylyltransferase